MFATAVLSNTPIYKNLLFSLSQNPRQFPQFYLLTSSNECLTLTRWGQSLSASLNGRGGMKYPDGSLNFRYIQGPGSVHSASVSSIIVFLSKMGGCNEFFLFIIRLPDRMTVGKLSSCHLFYIIHFIICRKTGCINILIPVSVRHKHHFWPIRRPVRFKIFSWIMGDILLISLIKMGSR